MIVQVSLEREFVPKFNGNRELAILEQIKVIHKAPSVALREKYTPRTQIRYNFDEAGKSKGGTAEIDVDRSGIITGMVTRFENLGYRDKGGRDKMIVNAKELFSDDTPSEFNDFIDELVEYLQGILSKKVETKNSESPSA